MLEKKQLVIIGSVLLLIAVVGLVIWSMNNQKKNKQTDGSKEGYYPCSKCQSFGRKVCVNRDEFKKLYTEGIMTENTIPQDGHSNWKLPIGLDYYQYMSNSGRKTC